METEGKRERGRSYMEDFQNAYNGWVVLGQGTELGAKITTQDSQVLAGTQLLESALCLAGSALAGS